MAQQASTSEAPRLPANGPTSSELRSAATRPCPTCNSPVSINASICPSCGDSLPSRNKQIRCRHCGGKAAAVLVVCPHCGRNLQPAPPRLLTWGAPLLLVAIFGAVLFAQLGAANPIAWSQRQIERGVTFVSDIGDQLQLDLSISIQPLEDENLELVSLPSQPQETADTDPAVEESAQSEDEGRVETPPAVEAASVQSEEAPPTPAPTEALANIATSEPTPTEAPPTDIPTEAPTVMPTVAPTVMPTSTPTLLASNNVTPSLSITDAPTAPITVTTTTASVVQAALVLPTPTPPAPTATPKVYRILAGDTLFEIALANDISLDALLTANGLSERDVYTIQPGDEIIIPDVNAPVETLPEATPTPMPTQGGFTYTVQPGDTLMAIGLRYGINLQRILDANGMTLVQARTLRPGQELIIPGDAPVAPTSTPTPTTAVTIPTATPIAAATTSKFRLDAPLLISPENRVSVKCGASEQLAWSAVPFIQPNDVYVVHLGYVNNRDADGVDQVVWVIAQQRPSNVTLWRLDDTLCGLAPTEYGRQWRWYVDVAEKADDGALTVVSPASEMWSFTWQ